MSYYGKIVCLVVLFCYFMNRVVAINDQKDMKPTEDNKNS